MSKEKTFCHQCYGFGFCGIESSIQANLKLMPPEHVASFIVTNEAYKVCPNHGLLNQLLGLTSSEAEDQSQTPIVEDQPVSDRLSRVEITLPQFESEQERQHFWQWLGGVFEVSGTLAFGRATNATGVPYCWPFLRIANEDPTIIGRFHELLQVNQKPHRNGTDYSHPTAITLNRHQAVAFTSRFAPFSPSRALAVHYFNEWAQTEKAGQIAILEEYNAVKDSAHPASKIHYLNLMENPAFLAGIIDAKGRVRDKTYNAKHLVKGEVRAYKRHRKGMRFFSSNLPLLEALNERFIGTRPTFSNRTYEWNIEGADYIALMELVQHHLKIVDPLLDDKERS